MARYAVSGQQHHDMDEEGLQNALADHYHNRKGEHPTCLCQDPAIPLYIARLPDRYVLKRWPNTGERHRYDCLKYEPPAEASGIGSLLGGAIKEEPITGMTALAVDFSLKKIGRSASEPKGMVPPEDAAEDATAPSAQGRKLTLKSILHYLWDKSELCRWVPGMEGRRNWAVISRHLNEVTGATQVKQLPLNQIVYVPPVWRQEEDARLRATRQSFFGAFHSRSGPKRIVMVLGEVKSMEASQFGYRLVLKSMPETRIYLPERKQVDFSHRYAFELQSWRESSSADRKLESHHLVVLLTATVAETGALIVEDIAALAVTGQWLPYANQHERLVVSTAVALKRKFLKPMTYNLGRGRTLPAIILVDTRPLQVNVFIKTSLDSEVLNRCRDELISGSRGHSRVWETDGGENIYDVLENLQAQPGTVQ